MQKETEFFSDEDVWLKKEEEYLNYIGCFFVEIKGIKYHAVVPREIIPGSDKSICFFRAIGNYKTFLDNHKNILTSYGFWTCRCETSFLHTPYSSFCEKCLCNIQDNTLKAKYLADL